MGRITYWVYLQHRPHRGRKLGGAQQCRLWLLPGGWTTPAVGLATLAVLVVTPRIWPKVPPALIAIAGVTAVTWGFGIDTRRSNSNVQFENRNITYSWRGLKGVH